jgi:hypothetical protein
MGPLLMIQLHLPNSEFWTYVLTPTIQFLQANPTECVIYLITNCGHTWNVTLRDPDWNTLFVEYMNNYGSPDPGNWGWGLFYTGGDSSTPVQVPTLNQVRGKIILAFSQGPDGALSYGSDSAGYGLDLGGFGLNAFGTYTNTTQLPDSKNVTFHVQGIYDDSLSTAEQQTAAI